MRLKRESAGEPTRRLAMAKTEQHAEKKKHTEHATICDHSAASASASRVAPCCRCLGLQP
eukprot:3640886-Rhodomonas_salina.1